MPQATRGISETSLEVAQGLMSPRQLEGLQRPRSRLLRGQCAPGNSRGLRDLGRDCPAPNEPQATQGVSETSLEVAQGPMCPRQLEGLQRPRSRLLRGQCAPGNSRGFRDLARSCPWANEPQATRRVSETPLEVAQGPMIPKQLEGFKRPRLRLPRGQ